MTPAVFYHVACLGNWRQVVREQLRLLAHVGLRMVNAVVLGTDEQLAEVQRTADECNVILGVITHSSDTSLCELPMLQAIHRWAKAQAPSRPCLYLHTKGVSRPSDPIRVAHRRLMQKHVVGDWSRHIGLLSTRDAVGVNWIESPGFAHFCGNFWLARSDWLAALDAPDVHREHDPERKQEDGEPRRQRGFAETWIGSRPGCRVESLACRNRRIWDDPMVFGFDSRIQGFEYEDSGMVTVISFYTRNGRYPALAERLSASCERFGIPRLIMEMPDAGSWLEGNKLKPQFILDRLTALDGPVLWVDADTEFVADPREALAAMAGRDFGIYNWHADRNNVNSVPFDESKLLGSGGVIYFDHTPAAIELLKRWIAALDATTREDQVLDRVFNDPNRPPVEPAWLPKAMNWMTGSFGPPSSDTIIRHDYVDGGHFAEPSPPAKLDLANIRKTTALVYSVGRTMFSAGAFCAFKACSRLGFEPFLHTSAYWCLSLALTMRSALKNPACKYIVTADGDTVYDWQHVAYLWTLMETNPHADAIAALQCKRDSTQILMNMASPTEVTQRDTLVPVTLAHFGLTIFRIDALRQVPQPWFLRLADENEPGESTDEDVYFWNQWVKSGRSAFVAPLCPVGHVDEFIMWPGANGRTIIQSWADFNETDERPDRAWPTSWELAARQKAAPAVTADLAVTE